MAILTNILECDLQFPEFAPFFDDYQNENLKNLTFFKKIENESLPNYSSDDREISFLKTDQA